MTGIGAYLAILYCAAFTTRLDPISPRFVLPVLPIAVMWLVDGHVVASGTDRAWTTVRLDRLAGWLVVALWLGGFLWSVSADLGQPSRPGDLAATGLGSEDRGCLAESRTRR